MDRECICKIRDIYSNIAAFEAQLQRQLHLNMNDAMLLCIVAEHENISSGELADELQLTPSNASKVIASLENRNLIKRKTCKEDKRCMRFAITKDGKELLEHFTCDSLQLPEQLQSLTI